MNNKRFLAEQRADVCALVYYLRSKRNVRKFLLGLAVTDDILKGTPKLSLLRLKLLEEIPARQPPPPVDYKPTGWIAAAAILSRGKLPGERRPA